MFTKPHIFICNICDVWSGDVKITVEVEVPLSTCRCDQVNSLTLYPWIHQFSNNKTSTDQTRPVSFPDVNPQSLPPNTDFSMAAGDFVEIYSESSQ